MSSEADEIYWRDAYFDARTQGEKLFANNEILLSETNRLRREGERYLLFYRAVLVAYRDHLMTGNYERFGMAVQDIINDFTRDEHAQA